jgi:hypothetical protein
VRALPLALLLAAASAVAAAQNAADPVAFVRAIYRGYEQDKPTVWFERPYAPGLKQLVAQDQKRAETDGPRIDWDPFINGQDWKIADLAVTLVSRAGDRAVVEARFTNLGHPEDLRYTLVNASGHWLIGDLENLVKPRWTMSKILAGAPDAFPDEPAK